MIKINNPKQFLKLPASIVEDADVIFLDINLGKETIVNCLFGNLVKPENTLTTDRDGNTVTTEYKVVHVEKGVFTYKSNCKINTPDFYQAIHEEAIEKIKEFAPYLELEIFGL
jgi:hypothetical protein